MRKFISMMMAVFFMITVYSTAFAGGYPVNPYSDVNEGDWYYDSVTQLYWNNIALENEKFYPEYSDTRGDFVFLLYRLYLCFGGEVTADNVCPFNDVNEDMYYYDAVVWAVGNGLVSGVSATKFEPEIAISNEQACVIIMRYADKFNVKVKKLYEDEQFTDSLKVSYFARSAVAACKMAGLVYSKEGYFYPQEAITRAESAALLYTLLCVEAADYTDDADLVSTKNGAYDHLYENYKEEAKFTTALVPWSEPVDLSYFDDAVLIGDSVTVSLEYYCAASGALGNATFLASTSLSPVNAMSAVSASSKHPSYRGKKMKVEDAVAASGAKKVYIMLGINCLSGGVDYTASATVKLVEKILEKSPDVKIIIQSVTPMASTSNIITNALNNKQIDAYNAKMMEICQNNGWYFVNVAEAVKDQNGALISSYCSDKSGMGIHFTFAGDDVWVNYLKTHVPDELK